MIKRIILIDDDLDFTDACRNFLESAGYEVFVENSENNVLLKICQINPNLIILDVVMDSKRSGFDIAEKINSDDTLRNIPLIFLTGYFKKNDMLDQENEMKKKWLNVKEVLDKPIKPAVLLETIKRI